MTKAHLYINHGNGYQTLYGHLSSTAFPLGTPNASVLDGQIFGSSGNTGWSTGPHLHFEVRNSSGASIDPSSNGLWKDGQWANLSRPIPAPHSGGEILIDDNPNNSDGFTKGQGGPFNNPCTGTGGICPYWYQGTGYYYTEVNGNTEDYWARWIPALPSGGGVYEILVYVPDTGAGTTTWQVAYSVVHANGTTKTVIDQEGARGRWVSIGTYRMQSGHYLYMTDATGETQGLHCGSGQLCRTGVDAVKFVRRATTYTPDVRAGNGYVPKITVRSNGGTARVNISFFRENGTIVCGPWPELIFAHAVSSFSCMDSQVASAIVDGSQDLSVVVESIYDSGGRYLADAYPGKTQPALVNYAPLVLKRWPTLRSDWRQTTDLFLFNPNSQSATVTVTFYDSWTTNSPDSGSFSINNISIAPNERKIVYGTQMPTWEASLGGSLASARVESTQPLAITTRTLVGLANSAGNIDTPYLAGSYLAEGSPANVLYASTAAREYLGYDSSLQVQNASASGTSFTISYYWLNQLNPAFTVNATVGPYRSANFWRPAGMPVGFFGSAKVESNSPLAVMAQYDRFDTGSSRYGVTQYEGVSSLNAATAMAHIQKEALYTPLWTYTGIQAQNMNASSVNIQLHYFRTDGTSAGSSVIKSNVPANYPVNFWSTPGEIPVFNGSGISGVGNVALMVNFDRLGDPGWQNKDGMMGYAAVK